MSYGYTLKTAQRNKAAGGDKVGVALGRVCIERCIPVSEVAKHFGVTRQTVYNWFDGSLNVRADRMHAVTSYIASLR